MSSNRPFECSACSQTFTRNENLERHRRSKHGLGTNRPFQCPLCQARFARRDVCKRHVERCRNSGSTSGGSSIWQSERSEQHSNDHISQGRDHRSHRRHLGQRDPARSEDDNNVSPAAHVSLESPVDVPVPIGASPGGIDTSSPEGNKTVASSRSSEAYITAYFECFHPSFPLLHRPSLDDETPELLRDIIVAIGCLYAARGSHEEGGSACVRLSRSLWDTGRKRLARLVGSDWRELRRIWTMQAWLLHIIYGAFMSGASQYNVAKQMLRTGVDAAQDLGLLRQSVATSASQPWIESCDAPASEGNAQVLRELWISYVNEESMKLCMYTLLFLDFHISAPCNVQTLTSSLDLDWELPYAIALWEADTPEAWFDRLRQEPRIQSFRGVLEGPAVPPYPATRSLALATQSMMSGNPSPDLMTALAASPMASLFVLTNIDALVRDFTRCYYQMPPALADPSAFHIFTQSQNRQILAALRHMLRVVVSWDTSGDGAKQTGPSPYRPIWQAIECMCLAIKIALYKPDDLLIGGIVDSSVVAGLATATHLTLGRYAGTRRSLESLLQHNSGDDAVVMILDEAMDRLSSLLSRDPQAALCEPPWATIAGYRIVMAIWRSLRWSAAEIRHRLARSQGEVREYKRFETCHVVFRAIMDIVMEQTALPGHGGGNQDEEMSVQVRDALLTASPELAEACFTKAVLKFWRKRSVWPIGTSMATVLEEIISDECPDFVY